jgi:hypothetical protein
MRSFYRFWVDRTRHEFLKLLVRVGGNVFFFLRTYLLLDNSYGRESFQPIINLGSL